MNLKKDYVLTALRAGDFDEEIIQKAIELIETARDCQVTLQCPACEHEFEHTLQPGEINVTCPKCHTIFDII